MGSACSEVTNERTAFPSRNLTCFPGAMLQTRRDSPTFIAFPVGQAPVSYYSGLEILMPSLPQRRVGVRVIIMYVVFLLTCYSLWSSEHNPCLL